MNSFDPFLSMEYQKSPKNQTFLNEEPKLSQKSDSQYLSEILSSCFSGTSKQITEHTEIDNIAEKYIEEEKPQGKIIRSQSSSSNRKLSKNSPFHNFQKHLVITLRQILSLKVLTLKGGLEYELAAMIFEYFKKSAKTSRSFLEQVFGLFENQNYNAKDSFMKSLRQGELSGILRSYSDETINLAQQILKNLTKIQLDEYDIQECLFSRKIEKKHEFIDYINLFKRQLVEGKQRKKAYKILANKFQKP